MEISSKQWFGAGGFTRTDAITLVGVVFLIVVLMLAKIVSAGEKYRVFVCAHHMKTLGGAFTEYAQDHDGAMPSAVVDDGTNSTSWDREIAIYLQPELAKPNSPEAIKTLEAKIAPLFKCPSDRELHGNSLPRSYSMPIYDISRVGWPPGKNSTGGLGLYLDAKTIRMARAANSADSPDFVPAIKTSMVPDPTDTALLVEHISILNALWTTKDACVVSADAQFDAKTFSAKDFHGGKMNYLMLDGHVELMSPAQSTGLIGGVWTIRKGD